jgi:hypothetical protein
MKMGVGQLLLLYLEVLWRYFNSGRMFFILSEANAPAGQPGTMFYILIELHFNNITSNLALERCF